jgi:hypothetical protein
MVDDEKTACIACAVLGPVVDEYLTRLWVAAEPDALDEGDIEETTRGEAGE